MASPRQRSKARTYTAEQRQEALRLYVEHGPAEASRRTGIPSGTVRAWAHKDPRVAAARSEQAQAASAAARLTWAQRRATVAALAAEAAERLTQRAIDAAEAGRSRDGREWAGAAAILIDKSELLAGHATSRVEHSQSELVERAKRLRESLGGDELAERREQRTASG